MKISATSKDPGRTLVCVAIALPVRQPYSYSLPEHLAPQASPGKRVLVPFGKRTVTGYLLGWEKANNDFHIKHVLDVLDEAPLFPESMIPFFQWTASYYIHPIGQVIETALPAGLNLSDTAIWTVTEKGMQAIREEGVAPLEESVLKTLSGQPMGVRRLERTTGHPIPRALVHQMRRRKWLRMERTVAARPVRAKTVRMVGASDFPPPEKKLSSQREKILGRLREEGEMTLAALRKMLHTTSSLIRAMEKDRQVFIYEKAVYRDPFGDPIAPDVPPLLTDEQQQAVDAMQVMLGKGFAAVLLAGVTGSGKTEVYLRLAAATMKMGLAVVVMVPEIALISQTERRFRARFGEKVAVLHSGLSRGERYDQWMRIAKGSADIAIGARSCIFAPFGKIGLIIVDEEHDASYKQDGGLNYNARDLAIVRARHHGALAVLGSATPSLQSYHNATIGKYHLTTLSRRVNQQPLPVMTTVDLSKNRDVRGLDRHITGELKKSIQETLDAGQQALIFLNRRGFSAFPTCTHCGTPVRCNHCDISLTLHKKANAFRCHYCGYSKPATATCASCNSDAIKLLGVGTEKIQESMEKLFPEATVARMDRDTMTRKGSIVKVLKALKSRQIDILVGTQMIAKGHDFPGITLVGIICADLTLNFPDFRAGERTFQLLAQVAGRAGRGDRPGKVVLQTYNPEHFAIVSAREQNFESFYDEEIRFREALGYPPYTRMVAVRISGKERNKTAEFTATLGDSMRRLLEAPAWRSARIQLMGPVEAPLPRIADRHRWQILLKSSDAGSLHRFVNGWIEDNGGLPANRRFKVTIDVDPFFLM